MVKVRIFFFSYSYRLWTFCGRNFCGFGKKTPKPQNFFCKHFLSL